jgi:hypothetical protein
MDVYCPTDISLNTVKSMTIADDRLRYCPSWAAAKKKGQPKEDVHEKSVADHIKESANKKRSRRTKFFCRICHKFDHNMAECVQNPANWLITLEEGSTLEEGTDKFGEDCQEGKAWEAAKCA